MDIRERVSFGDLTTFKVGGHCAFVAEVGGESDYAKAIDFAAGKGLPLLPLGGGSNILGEDGVSSIVFMRSIQKGIATQEKDGGVLVIADAGVSWDELARFCVGGGLWGLENLSGIPGTVGGAAVQNIGAYGAAFSEKLVSIEAYDLTQKRMQTFMHTDCHFGYRTSLFKENPNLFVHRVTFLLARTGKPNLAYRSLAEHFTGINPDIASLRTKVLSIRAGKFPDLSREGTAGSFFKNPTVDSSTAAGLKSKYPELPLYTAPESGEVKVPLAFILDRVLSLRGYSTGKVRCYEQQPLVLVANADATAQEVRSLAFDVQQKVFTETALRIAPEVCILKNASFSIEI